LGVGRAKNGVGIIPSLAYDFQNNSFTTSGKESVVERISLPVALLATLWMFLGSVAVAQQPSVSKTVKDNAQTRSMEFAIKSMVLPPGIVSGSKVDVVACLNVKNSNDETISVLRKVHVQRIQKSKLGSVVTLKLQPAEIEKCVLFEKISDLNIARADLSKAAPVKICCQQSCAGNCCCTTQQKCAGPDCGESGCSGQKCLDECCGIKNCPTCRNRRLTETKEGGQNLPKAYYSKDDVQYFPTEPGFSFWPAAQELRHSRIDESEQNVDPQHQMIVQRLESMRSRFGKPLQNTLDEIENAIEKNAACKNGCCPSIAQQSFRKQILALAQTQPSASQLPPPPFNSNSARSAPVTKPSHPRDLGPRYIQMPPINHWSPQMPPQQRSVDLQRKTQPPVAVSPPPSNPTVAIQTNPHVPRFEQPTQVYAPYYAPPFRVFPAKTALAPPSNGTATAYKNQLLTASRALDSLAADFEENDEYGRADHLRRLAQEIRQIVRAKVTTQNKSARSFYSPYGVNR
jgi:hypothetical protein